MKNDTQHLDFLISQYVDQTLDANNRKHIEQQIAANPVAAALYKEHMEMQDVLDDWGNRLPLINWDEFDRTLAARLDRQAAIVTAPVSPFGQFHRILAIAAALLVAALLGYSWHAYTTTSTPVASVSQNPPAAPVAPLHVVTIATPGTTGPSMDSVAYEQPPAARGNGKIMVRPLAAERNAPPDGTALAQPRFAHNPGLQSLPANTGAVVGSAAKPAPKSERSDLGPSNF